MPITGQATFFQLFGEGVGARPRRALRARYRRGLGGARRGRAPTTRRKLALNRMREEGVKLTCTEMALFELTERAGTEQFRAISRLVK
jgi:hypothetical protein